jgi:hypothetical protein
MEMTELSMVNKAYLQLQAEKRPIPHKDLFKLSVLEMMALARKFDESQKKERDGNDI